MNDSSRSAVLLDTLAGSGRPAAPIEAEEQFPILVVGDFSGRANPGVRSTGLIRRPVEVNRDNFDEVFAAIGPELVSSQAIIPFSGMDDFHPDHLLGIDSLRRLLDEDVPAPPVPSAPASDSGLLDQILDESEPVVSPSPRAEFTGDLSDFIRTVVGPHLVLKENATQRERKLHREKLANEAMRALLHHPKFQKLEALWRSLAWLVDKLDTGGDLRIFLLNTTSGEILSDPEATRSLICGGTHRWAVIVLDHSFSQSAEDSRALAMLGRIALECQAPVLAEAAAPSGELSAEWLELRRSPEAHWLGLALPRFLLRLPYGQATSPIESFPFEEMPKSAHRDYLWGNPAICCAALLGRSFLEDGWRMRPGKHRRLDGLPLHIYREGSESLAKPCAEIVMTEKEAELLLEQGIMPLASAKEQDAAVLVRFQSVADPLAGIAGRWG